jgi:ribose 5-phosphate isomerase B
MSTRRIAIGSDHAGYEVKEVIKEQLVGLGYEVKDLGTHSTDSVDYPDFGRAVATSVAEGTSDQGILVCSSGIGMSMVANKVPGVRAALAWTEEVARLSREHNDANVLVIGARITPSESLEGIVRSFMDSTFAGGRHAQRVEKMMKLDQSE